MDKIVIQGGHKLTGRIAVSGAKNAALPILTSALLCEGSSHFSHVPPLNDIRTMSKLLRFLGMKVDMDDDGGTRISSDRVRKFEAPYELVKTMRASVLVLGPLLARYGRATVSLPGGCAIGARPIDQHLKGFEAMGATITLEHGNVVARARRLKGATIVCDLQTVTGTENLMMAACLARGTTVIKNAAQEPEIVDLAQVLTKMGARIDGAGSQTITIEGVQRLRACEHNILPDRIEAGTFLVAGALTRGDVTITHCVPGHLEAVMAKLRAIGARIDVGESSVRIRGSATIKPVDITTHPHPGFPTDMQAQFMAMLSVARGQSSITETIFENRYMHVQELARMGADIHIDGRLAIVRGVKRLTGAKVMATDLRASASLILAGLVASGKTEVLRVYHLDRGYDRIEKKLRKLGAHIRRTRDRSA